MGWVWGLVGMAWTLFVLVLPVQALPTSLTSNTTPTPYRAFASSIFAATYDAFKAFDGNNWTSSDCWATANGQGIGFVGFDFGAGSRHVLTGYSLGARVGDTSNTPMAWSVEGANSQAGPWAQLDSRYDPVAWSSGEFRYYTSAVPGGQQPGYQMFRINVSQKFPGANVYVAIGEFDLDTVPYVAPTPTPAPSSAPSASPSGVPTVSTDSATLSLVIPVIQSSEWRPAWDLVGVVLLKGIALAVLVVFFRGLV